MVKENKAKVEPVVQQEGKEIKIGGVSRKLMHVGLVGTTTFLSHKMAERAITKIEDKQQKKAVQTPGREIRNPERDYQESLYQLSDGRYGIKAEAFKQSAVSACRFMEALPMTVARGAFYVLEESDGLVVLNGSPRMRTDPVTIGRGKDIRYRGEFPVGWTVDLTIEYNENAISPDQILQLFNTAGFGVGVGDWRPGSPKGGSHGMFKVVGNGKK